MTEIDWNEKPTMTRAELDRAYDELHQERVALAERRCAVASATEFVFGYTVAVVIVASMLAGLWGAMERWCDD